MKKSSGLAMTVLTIVIITASLKTSYSQDQKIHYELSKYYKWSLVAGPVLYNKAVISPQYGEYSFENKPILGYNFGFEYDFYPDRKWSFITGLIVSMEPVYNIKFTIKEEDLYSSFEEDLVDNAKMSAMNSFSSPLMVRLNIQAGQNLFINFLTGLKVMYFPSGESEFTATLENEDQTETREVFGLKLASPENPFQGSFVIGTGLSYAMDKVLLKANLIYTMNFQNSISGEYQFANLFTSADTRGYYDLSGNYLGLLFSASLKKGKRK